jgi:hypothetical protein
VSVEPRPEERLGAVTASGLPSGSGLSDQIGRYFAAVSFTSSLTLVGAVVGVAASGALQGTPSLSNIVMAFRDIGIRDAFLLGLAAVVVGLALHPLQFAMVQLLEGYWGASRIAVASAATLRHRSFDRVVALDNQRERDSNELEELELRRDAAIDREDPSLVPVARALELRWLRLIASSEEAARLREKYPAGRDRVMPTALGNRLRRAEDLAGAAYGIDAVTAGPHLALLAAPDVRLFYDDTTTELDTSVRYCLVWTLVSVLITLAMWDDGWWLTLSAGTYLLAWLSYRGAVTAAEEHGVALRALVDLTRFRLYDAMGASQPYSSKDERAMNAGLMELLRGDSGAYLRYAIPQASNAKSRSSRKLDNPRQG